MLHSRADHIFWWSVFLGISLTAVFSCRKKPQIHSFTKHYIEFQNNLIYSDTFNAYLFRNFYNGGGVAVGDINNDGLADIYLAGNQVDNKLLLNKGHFVFEDITQKAGVACPEVWSTGVNLVDINGDGWLDIYVCKSGPAGGAKRHNELFINNRNLTFTEKSAEYGLNETGLSVHAAFFDYDLDGDLDCYLLNNAIQSVVNFTIVPEQRKIREVKGGNKLLRNDQGHYVDVSADAGIFGSKIGFGLGVSISDVNVDGWPDMYISNDFFERDYLYLNQKDGTFKECLEEQITEISMGAMGADIADINNDGWPDIFVTDMLPMTPERYKSKTQFEDWNKYQLNVRNGYYHQYTRNTLQLNNGNGTFSEIGRLAGVSASDWSWGALFMDLNNDGWNDIFVANGIFKDLTDQDYINYMTNPDIVSRIQARDPGIITKLMDSIPSVPIANCVFINQRDFTFRDESKLLELDEPSFSNGSAFGDLDNDGDLDLVLNNINMPSVIYENKARQNLPFHFLAIQSSGHALNTSAIGTRLTLHYGDSILLREMYPGRGFMSSSDYRLHFGLGEWPYIDSLVIYWPSGIRQTFLNPPMDTLLKIEEPQNLTGKFITNPFKPLLTADETVFGQLGLHNENDFNDFARDHLMFHQLSREGPRVAIGDINGDGIADIAAGNGSGHPAKIYYNEPKGFKATTPGFLDSNKLSEYVVVHAFDADQDNDLDLYFGAGGNEFPQSSFAMIDWMLINDGRGKFTCTQQTLPSFIYQSTSAVCNADIDGDGDEDLFVGARNIPLYYGVQPPAFLLLNDGSGLFQEAPAGSLPDQSKFGMVTDATFADLNSDNAPDLIVVGEWMAPEVFLNRGGKFIRDTLNGLNGYTGWWHRILVEDIDDDGDLDLIAANHGLNSRYKANKQSPIYLIINDYDRNGAIDPIYAYPDQNHILYPFALKQDLVRQIPSLNKKYLKYANYSTASLENIFGQEILANSLKLEATEMRSMVFLNDGQGNFSPRPLPIEAQFSPVYALLLDDVDGDGRLDVLAGGNFAGSKPEAGNYQAGYGLFLHGQGDGTFTTWNALQSGLNIRGQIRDIKKIPVNDEKYYVFFRNNDAPVFYKLNK